MPVTRGNLRNMEADVEDSVVQSLSSEEIAAPTVSQDLLESILLELQALKGVQTAVEKLSSEVHTLRSAHEQSSLREADEINQARQSVGGPSLRHADSFGQPPQSMAPGGSHPAPVPARSFLTAPLTSLGHRPSTFFEHSTLRPPAALHTAADDSDWLKVLKPPSIQSWDGKSDPEEWLLDTKSILLSLLPPGADLQELDRAVPRVILKLQGVAKSWWMEWRSRITTYPTWEEFKAEALKLQLVDKVKLARDKLASMKQTGTIPDYVAYLNKITMQIPGLSEEEKYYRFKEGVKPHLKMELEKVIALYGGKTLQEAIQYLQAVEVIDKDRFRTPRTPNGGKPGVSRRSNQPGTPPPPSTPHPTPIGGAPRTPGGSQVRCGVPPLC